MLRTLKKLFLLFFLGTFILSVQNVLEHWNYKETRIDIIKQLHLGVSSEDIRVALDIAIKKQNYDDARIYLNIAKTHNYSLNFSFYNQLISKQDTQFKKVSRQISNFSQGFVKGESANMAGIVGAISADFTVVGDVRDLKKQYDIHLQNKQVNELIVILSGAGIGLTAASVVSLGVVTPAKAGASLVKLAVKTRRLTSAFQKQLLTLGRKVFDWSHFIRLIKKDKSIKSFRQATKQAYHPEAIQPLKRIAIQINVIRKASSAPDTLFLLKFVESVDDLRHLEKIIMKHGRHTKGYLKLIGKGALRTVKVLQKSTELLFSLLSSFLSLFFSSVYLFPRWSAI